MYLFGFMYLLSFKSIVYSYKGDIRYILDQYEIVP